MATGKLIFGTQTPYRMLMKVIISILRSISGLDRKWTISLSDFVQNHPNLNCWSNCTQTFSKDLLLVSIANGVIKIQITSGLDRLLRQVSNLSFLALAVQIWTILDKIRRVFGPFPVQTGSEPKFDLAPFISIE